MIKVYVYCQRDGCGGRAFYGIVERDEFSCAMCAHLVPREAVRAAYRKAWDSAEQRGGVRGAA